MHCLAFAGCYFEMLADCTSCTLQHEVPFAHPLPHYPINKEPSLAPTFADKQEVCH